jgi:hypothetical protein
LPCIEFFCGANINTLGRFSHKFWQGRKKRFGLGSFKQRNHAAFSHWLAMVGVEVAGDGPQFLITFSTCPTNFRHALTIVGSYDESHDV